MIFLEVTCSYVYSFEASSSVYALLFSVASVFFRRAREHTPYL